MSSWACERREYVLRLAVEHECSGLETAVLVLLSEGASREQFPTIFHSRDDIAKKLGKSVNSIKNAIAQLKKKGVIETRKTSRPGRLAEYTLNTESYQPSFQQVINNGDTHSISICNGDTRSIPIMGMENKEMGIPVQANGDTRSIPHTNQTNIHTNIYSDNGKMKPFREIEPLMDIDPLGCLIAYATEAGKPPTNVRKARSYVNEILARGISGKSLVKRYIADLDANEERNKDDDPTPYVPQLEKWLEKQ